MNALSLMNDGDVVRSLAKQGTFSLTRAPPTSQKYCNEPFLSIPITSPLSCHSLALPRPNPNRNRSRRFNLDARGAATTLILPFRDSMAIFHNLRAGRRQLAARRLLISVRIPADALCRFVRLRSAKSTFACFHLEPRRELASHSITSSALSSTTPREGATATFDSVISKLYRSNIHVG